MTHALSANEKLTMRRLPVCPSFFRKDWKIFPNGTVSGPEFDGYLTLISDVPNISFYTSGPGIVRFCTFSGFYSGV